MTTFTEFFQQATGVEKADPYPYQMRLAEGEELPALLDIPTGLGKTLAVVLAWLWRRLFSRQSPDKTQQGFSPKTPRRLVYCLPMRVLVEQTEKVICDCLKRLQPLANEHKIELPRVHVLMGGEDATDWAVWPERETVLLGTQDMLLSRALNRGYAASRARWPVEFGLLHNDCLWVLDEVQLMGSGLATTAQLDAFAKQLWAPARPSRFLWMSATLGGSFLETRDRKDWKLPTPTPARLKKEDYAEPKIQKRLHANKGIQLIKDRPKAAKILDSHPRGRISLVVVNTVPVAKGLHQDLRQELAKPASKRMPKRSRPEICLLHSRFRPMDREQQMNRLLAFIEKMDEGGAAPDSEGLIVVSTQVVEAGFDLSAVRLWSEIAPWPSVIQRLGRLNREGEQPEASAVFWMPKADESNKGDAGPNAKRIGPYEKKAVETARKLLESVIATQTSGLQYREALDTVLATKESQETLRIEPEVVIRPDDFFELFSTEPDLAGGFTNISQFVRDQDRNLDVHVFWRDFDPAKARQLDESPPIRGELCSVPFFEFRQFVDKVRLAWEWNFEPGKWELRRGSEIQPGMTLMLPRSAGGYRTDVGWTGSPGDRDFEIWSTQGDNESLGTDFSSGSQDWIALSAHLADVEAEMCTILQASGLQATPWGMALMTATRWHDWGKSVAKWQDAVREYAARACKRLEGVCQTTVLPGFETVAAEWRHKLTKGNSVEQLWGKFPDVRAASMDERLALTESERAKLRKRLGVPFRPNLRHEAAGALAAWQSWLANADGLTALAVYLIACHHGKVRTILRSSQSRGDDVFGLKDEMELQPVAGFFPNSAKLCTSAKFVGACGNWDETNATFTLTSPSWLQMVAELLGPKREDEPEALEVLDEHEPCQLGPLILAYLEALLRAADVRASRWPGKGGKS